jgi:streptogramin lyase
LKQQKNITTNCKVPCILFALQFFCLPLYAQQDAPLLQAPIDFSLDTQGRIYVADSISRGGIFRFDDMTGSNATEIGITCQPSQRDSQECKLADPQTIFVDETNRIFVSDVTGRIVTIDQQKSSWTSIPSNGNVPENIFVDTKGEIHAIYDNRHVSNCEDVDSLRNPRGMFVDNEERVYLADSGNDQIVRITPDCKIETFGQKGCGEKQFNEPGAVYLDSKGRIYVSDTGNHRIVRIDDFTGKGWVTFGKFGQSLGEFRYPHKIFVDTQNRIYVGDYGNGRIVQIDTNSNDWTILPLRNRKQEFSNPVDVTADSSGRIYVVDESDKRIVRIDNMNGDGWINWQGTPQEKLQQPVSIFSHDNQVYVIDSEKRCILELDSSFKESRSISTKDFFVRPNSLCLDNTGRIFLTDLYDHAIGRLDNMTDPKKKEIFWGKDKQSFDHPSGIFVSEHGRIYVADTLKQRIVRMDDLQGKNWTELPLSKKNVSPVDLSIDSRGRLYILDADAGRIIRVNNMLGQGWIEFGNEGFGRKQFYRPSTIYLDSKDRLFIADTGNRRIVRIDDLTGKGWVTVGETSAPQILLFRQN